MAPKAKVKAKAKAKGLAKVRARPAGHGRVRGRRLRRPAGAEDLGSGVAPMEDRWRGGEQLAAHELSAEILGTASRMVVEVGHYYHGPCKVAGVNRGIKLEDGETWIQLEATGTNHDLLLRWLSGRRPKMLRVIRCARGCNHELAAEDIVHAERIRQVEDWQKEDGWMSNLIEVLPSQPMDDIPHLRQRDADLQPPEREPVDLTKEKDKKETAAKKKKKKKKKDKEKKEKSDGSKGSKGEGAVLNGTRAKQSGTKKISALYAGTGLDPQEKVRRRVAKRAKRYLAKKAEKVEASSSSSSSNSSSSSTTMEVVNEHETVFSQASKVRRIFDGFPGALGASALTDMRRAILQELGEEDVAGALKPVALLYFKQQLSRRMQGPALREAHTICACLDLAMRGRSASLVDCLVQRLKSIEQTLNGCHWTVSQKLEVLPAETTSLTPMEELGSARKEVEAESKTRYQASLGDNRRNPKGSSEGKEGQDRRYPEDNKKGGKGNNQKGKDKKKEG